MADTNCINLGSSMFGKGIVQYCFHESIMMSIICHCSPHILLQHLFFKSTDKTSFDHFIHKELIRHDTINV